MKINEMSIYLSITNGCKKLGSEANSQPGKKDYSPFYLINFHRAGEPEAFICCVIKDSASA
jgi:hypothetical protein